VRTFIRLADQEESMSTQPTAVLVHGAFADASGFAAVIRALQSQGVSVRAPMNPLRGLASDAEAIARYTTTIDGPIVLVGHSYGGAVISEAAPQVSEARALVFLAAFAPDEGESCVSVMEPFPPSLLATTNVATPYDAPGAAGGPDLFIKIEDFREAFCADLSEDVAAPMAVSQRPLAATAFTEAATAVGWKRLPSWYLVSEHDNAIPPDCERFMAERMRAVTESVTGSHAAFIAQPEVATRLILKAIASL
jgi:pimeloyl-ACP methyl ester carboxylesterase